MSAVNVLASKRNPIWSSGVLVRAKNASRLEVSRSILEDLSNPGQINIASRPKEVMEDDKKCNYCKKTGH